MRIQYNPSGITLSTQGVTEPQCDVNGNLKVVVSGAIGGSGYSTFLVSGAIDGSSGALGRIKASPGTITYIDVGVAGAASSTISVYDALTVTGSPIAIIDGSTTGSHAIFRTMATGITVVSVDSGGTLRATVSYL